MRPGRGGVERRRTAGIFAPFRVFRAVPGDSPALRMRACGRTGMLER
ncbi:hypothetical protein KPATCC21470_2921 [Kitasatospora purpeofusca]